MREWLILGLRYKSIAWVVIAAVLALAVIPVHLHVHHAEEGAAHLHEMDLHVETGLSDHGHHDETHILDASPDALTKPFDFTVEFFVPLALLTLLLPLVLASSTPWRRAAPVQARSSYYHLIPPLRAPPRH